MTYATHVNGWEPAVYMSCMSQNFRLFHVSNLFVRNYRIFLLMYTGSVSPPVTDRLNGGREACHLQIGYIRRSLGGGRGTYLETRSVTHSRPLSDPRQMNFNRALSTFRRCVGSMPETCFQYPSDANRYFSSYLAFVGFLAHVHVGWAHVLSHQLTKFQPHSSF